MLALAGPKVGRTRVAIGLRTDERKLIRHYDTEKDAFVESELYDLTTDPNEVDNRYEADEPPALQERLMERIAETGLLVKLEQFQEGHGVDSHPDVSKQVADRLAELGYA